MKSGRTAALVITAIALPTLAACSGGSSSGNNPAAGTAGGGNQPTATSPASSARASQSATAAATTGANGLTPPGTHLGFGKDAIVGWVPPAQDTGTGAHKGLKLQVTVESIQKGTLADFRNVDLDANERKSTPYYVEVRLTALGSTQPPKDNDPALTFTAIDDRGQAQDNVTFLGTFQRCDDPSPPTSFVNGKSYQSCLTYLIPGGGSITSVEWKDGPAPGTTCRPTTTVPSCGVPDLADRLAGRPGPGPAGTVVAAGPGGRDTFEMSLDMLATRGTLVLYGQSSGPVAAGRLSPRIAGRFPLSRSSEAHSLLADRKVLGKILLQA